MTSQSPSYIPFLRQRFNIQHGGTANHIQSLDMDNATFNPENLHNLRLINFMQWHPGISGHHPALFQRPKLVILRATSICKLLRISSCVMPYMLVIPKYTPTIKSIAPLSLFV
jgi:hypothetical protein